MTLQGSASVSGAMSRFCQFLRTEGYTIGISETLDALRIAHLGAFYNQTLFERSLCSLFSTSREESERFRHLFETFWSGSVRRRHAVRRSPVGVTPSRNLAVLLQEQHAVKPSGSEAQMPGASAAERLLRKDFARVRLADQEALEALADRLFRRMSQRLSRKRTAKNTGAEVDLRRTIRHSIARGGMPIDLAFLARKPRRRPITVLLDVSASMDKYSHLLLRFMHALGRRYARVNSFVFSTRLRCITRAMQRCIGPEGLADLIKDSDAWRGGTRIGRCLEDFLCDRAAPNLSRNSLVLVLSDGLDTGDPDHLALQVRRLRQRARRLLWLSPLLGSEEYEPVTRGIQAILPHVDDFLPAHNLESLLQLEAHLVHA